MNRMKVVYIAGPFRAATSWGIEQNVRAAEAVALEVAKLGAMPMCPHKNTQHFHGLLTAQFWIDGTLELMRRCDAVMLVGDWRSSSGTMGEMDEAARIKIPIFEKLEQLERWLGNVD